MKYSDLEVSLIWFELDWTLESVILETIANESGFFSKVLSSLWAELSISQLYINFNNDTHNILKCWYIYIWIFADLQITEEKLQCL